MRVSPCAWVSLTDRGLALSYARQSAECTHNHTEGIKGAMAVADCIWFLANGGSRADMRRLAEVEYALNHTCDQLRQTNSFNETCQVTVPQAITCFLERQSLVHAVRSAGLRAGDSDTIAAIAGSLAEASQACNLNL